MELSEMIKVMQHYQNDGDIEFSRDNFKTILGEANKENDGKLSWNWDEFDYRIKKITKVTIEKWLCRDKREDFIIIETSNIDNYNLYEKVKLMEIYEVDYES